MLMMKGPLLSCPTIRFQDVLIQIYHKDSLSIQPGWSGPFRHWNAKLKLLARIKAGIEVKKQRASSP
jgi:hypothetical protein